MKELKLKTRVFQCVARKEPDDTFYNTVLVLCTEEEKRLNLNI